MVSMGARGVAFGDWLRTAREQAGLSQRDFADAFGVKQPVVSRMENGLKQKLSRAEVIVIADIVNKSHKEALEAAGMDPDEEVKQANKVVRSFDPDDPRLRLLAASDALGLEWTEDMVDVAEKAVQRKYKGRTDIVGKKPNDDEE